MNETHGASALVTTLALTMGLSACGGGDGEPGPTSGNPESCAAGVTGTYVAFDPANYENQLKRVDAYEAIKKTRKGDDFAAGDFGDLAAVDPSKTDPSDDTFASLYVETADLAAKVAGRKDDHGYKLSYPEGEVGAYLDALVRTAIGEGAAATAGAGDVGGIGWHAQRIDKGVQHFFYLSVFHELMEGARKNWDEAFGYYGRDSDGDPSKGIAATVAARDDNCGLGLNDAIYARLQEGKCELEKALTEAGADAVDVSATPALGTIVKDIDLQLLTAFALSAAREFRDLPSSKEPAIKLIEGRMFVDILEPYLTDRDAAAAAFVRAEVDKDDPSAVDAAGVVAKITEVFGLEQTFADCK